MTRSFTRAFAAAIFLSVPAAAQLVTLTPVADNTLYEDPAGSLSNGSGTTLYCGRTGSFGGPPAARRTLLKFDIAAVAPPGTAIIYADLTMQCSQGQGGSAQIEVRRMTSAWGEGASDAGVPGGGGAGAATGDATWLHTFYSGSFWTTPGGDFTSNFSAKTTVNSVGTYVFGPTFELKNDAQDMLDNPGSNHGWMLLAPEIPGQAKRFESRESLGSEPTLTLIFAPAFPATKTIVGTGCIGTSGQPFTLDAFGYTGAPVLGDDQYAFVLFNGPVNTFSTLFFSTATTAPQSFGGGCNLYIDLNGLVLYASLGFGPFPVFLDSSGVGGLSFAIPPVFQLTGFSSAVQVFAPDAGNPAGFVLSNALALTLGV